MIITDNPERDYLQYEREEQKWLEKRPVCNQCGEPIQSYYTYEIDGYLFCEGCMEQFKNETEEYVEE